MQNQFAAIFVTLILLFALPSWTGADLIRGLENYIQILKGEKKIESFTLEEQLEVIDIRDRLRFATVDACNPTIESQIDGTFRGWRGDTVFKLLNGQIWQQVSYDYTYEYDYMPEVIIYPSRRGTCMFKVEDVDEVIAVQRLK